MSFDAITCSKCGAPMQWDGVSNVITCSHCGTYYERRIQPQKRNTAYLMQDGAEIMNTQNETSDIQRSMYQSASDTSDRVNEKRSDYFNEVNSFISSDGYTVKADIKYDHLYQNTENPDLYLGSENPIDPSGFSELKKKW